MSVWLSTCSSVVIIAVIIVVVAVIISALLLLFLFIYFIIIIDVFFHLFSLFFTGKKLEKVNSKDSIQTYTYIITLHREHS